MKIILAKYSKQIYVYIKIYYTQWFESTAFSSTLETTATIIKLICIDVYWLRFIKLLWSNVLELQKYWLLS